MFAVGAGLALDGGQSRTEVITMQFGGRKFLAGFLVLWSGWSVCARAQQFQGSFAGTVVDPSGAVIPGAAVTAVEQGKGLERSVQTLGDGYYEIALLPPGRYSLTAEKAGFEKIVQGPIELTVNQHLKMDFQMKVGAQTTTITVEATSPAVETQTSSVGTTIEQAKVDQIPLNGRNFQELALLAPGPFRFCFRAFWSNPLPPTAAKLK